MSSSDISPTQKTNKGRQRVDIARMENTNNLQVTFSKRRAGLFKKCSEFCALTGAEVAAVVFSPTGKPYTFGHPNFQTIVDRFDPGNPNPLDSSSNYQLPQVPGSLNAELARIEQMIEVEKKRKEQIKQAMEDLGVPKIEEMSYKELVKMKRDVLTFKKELEEYLKSSRIRGDAGEGNGDNV